MVTQHTIRIRREEVSCGTTEAFADPNWWDPIDQKQSVRYRAVRPDGSEHTFWALNPAIFWLETSVRVRTKH